MCNLCSDGRKPFIADRIVKDKKLPLSKKSFYLPERLFDLQNIV
jgi:hypothetical protein